jgi:hypothetical protein
MIDDLIEHPSGKMESRRRRRRRQRTTNDLSKPDAFGRIQAAFSALSSKSTHREQYAYIPGDCLLSGIDETAILLLWFQ